MSLSSIEFSLEKQPLGPPSAEFLLEERVRGSMSMIGEAVLLRWIDEQAVGAVVNALHYGVIEAGSYTMFTTDKQIRTNRPIVSNRWAARQIRNANLGYDSLVKLYTHPASAYTIENNGFTQGKPEVSLRSDDWSGAFADARILADYGPSENAALVAANQDGLVHRFMNP